MRLSLESMISMLKLFYFAFPSNSLVHNESLVCLLGSSDETNGKHSLLEFLE